MSDRLADLERRLAAQLDALVAEKEALARRAAELDARERALVERAEALAKRERALAREVAKVRSAAAAAAPATHEPEAASAAEPPPAPEPAPRPARRASAQPPEPSPTPAEQGGWNLERIDRLIEERAAEDPERAEEWRWYVLYLRDFAAADGTLPPSFDGFVLDVFGDLVGAAREA